MPTQMSTRMGKPLSTDFDRVLRTSRLRFSHGLRAGVGDHLWLVAAFACGFSRSRRMILSCNSSIAS